MRRIASVRTGEAQVVRQDAVDRDGVDRDTPKVISTSTGRRARRRSLGSSARTAPSSTTAYAEDHDLNVGSPLELLTPTGKTLDAPCQGHLRPADRRLAVRHVTISAATFDAQLPAAENLFTFVTMEGGVTTRTRRRSRRRCSTFPNAKVQTQHEFIDNQFAGSTASSTSSTSCSRCR